MFWRQATNAKILVDAYGKALVYASAGSEFNNCCIAYRPDSDTVAVAEIVMVEGIDGWGSTEITVSTADNVRSFTIDGTTYSFTDGQAITPAITVWVPILTYQYDSSGQTNFLCTSEGKIISVDTVPSGDNVQIRALKSGEPHGLGYWSESTFANTVAHYEQMGGIETVEATRRQDNGLEFDLGEFHIILNGDEELNTTPVQLT